MGGSKNGMPPGLNGANFLRSKTVAEHLQRMADRYDMNAILEFLDKSRAASPVSQS